MHSEDAYNHDIRGAECRHVLLLTALIFTLGFRNSDWERDGMIFHKNLELKHEEGDDLQQVAG
jgi:hypothetical protein